MINTRPVRVLGAALAALAAIGCDNDDSDIAAAPGTAGVIVSPRDGAEQVAPGMAIVFQFDTPPNRVAVERNVHLYNESASMLDSLCAQPGMEEMMSEGVMMGGAVPGTFRWTSDTRCEFMPDAPMEPGASYRLHMGEGMMSMTGGSGRMIHFRTAESGPSSGEHEGHHN